MNSKIKGIIAGSIALVCLGGTVVLLKSTEKTDDTSSSISQAGSSSADSSESEVVILPNSSDTISSVDIDNSTGSFSVEQPASGKSTWSIEALSGVNQDTDLLSSLIENCGQMTAYKLVEENVTDMAKYGLDEPEASFTINYTDNSSIKVLIGIETPNNERYSYVCIEGEDKVYMVLGTKLSYFTESANAYVSTQLIAEPDDDSWPEYGTETIERTDLDYKMVFENDPYDIEGMISSQVMTEPIFSYLDVSTSTDITHGLWGLSAQGCAVVHPNDEDMAEHGLTEPACTVSLKGDEYDYVLKIGNPVYSSDEISDSNTVQTVTGYYCYLTGVSGVDCIYEISADQLPWLTVDPSDIISGVMTSNYLVDLSNIKIEYNGKTHSYDIETDGTSEWYNSAIAGRT
ncbi:MAG: DUF4340 domain-containing protein, partial [Hominimerdicola sp.]